MRKGFTLIEVIITVAVLGMVSVGLTALFAVLVNDVPRSARAMEVNSLLTGMLLEMRSDVESARSLPAAGNAPADEKTLRIRLPDGLVCYEFKDGRVVRRKTGPDGKAAGSRTWPLPNVKIRWNVRQRAGRRYAVEVRTGVEVTIARRRQERLMNAHMFFLGAAWHGRLARETITETEAK